MKLGDKFPYATGSFQPGVGAVGVSPLVSTQFQFADVGVNVDLTPTIHTDEEVTLQVEIDISNVRDRIDVGGLSQPVIGQRKLTQSVRLRQGEVSVVGGLMVDQDTRSLSGTPGLANIPILGRLFSGEAIEKNKSELLIALVPHLVRTPEITPENLRGIAVGTDATVKLSYAPRMTGSEVAAAGPAPAPEPAQPAQPARPPLPFALPGMPAGAQPAAPRARFAEPRVQAPLSAAVTLSLELDNAADIAQAPMKITWDPKILRLNEAEKGTLLSGDGQQPMFTRNIRNDAGEASIVLSRLPGAGGVTGSGPLVKLTFQAVGKGTTEVKVVDLNLRTTQMQPVNIEAPTAQVEVQ